LQMTALFCPPANFFAFAPKKGLHFAHSRAIIVAFPFGGLAQLVRAPASHAGGLGFESLILHQTVRIQTHASMRRTLDALFLCPECCAAVQGWPQWQEQTKGRAPGEREFCLFRCLS